MTLSGTEANITQKKVISDFVAENALQITEKPD